MKKSEIKKLKNDVVAVDCTLSLFADKDVCKSSERLRDFISKIESGELVVSKQKVSEIKK